MKPTVTALTMTLARITMVTALLPSTVCGAHAAEAIVVIHQPSAESGGITPGDARHFPIMLDRSGKYRLASNLVVPADTSGIVITAPAVTLDLDGHTVAGPVRCSRNRVTWAVNCDAASKFSAVVGISSVAATGAVIRNGTVEGFAGLGVHYGEGTTLDKLLVRANAGVGIAGAGYAVAGAVRAVRVEGNGRSGIVCEHLRIERSVFAGNGGTGVDCRASWFIRTVTRHNAGAGVAEGPRHGLHSYGNRLADERGVARDRLAVLEQARR